MKLIAYIAVEGARLTIERFQAVAGRGVIKTFEAKNESPGVSMWRTEREALDTTAIEHAIDAYLKAKNSVLEAIREHRDEFTQAYLMLVIRYDNDDAPRGFSISQDAIQVLAKVDAAFEIDVVTVLDESLS